MNEPSKMSISVTSESHGRKSKIRRSLTLQSIIEWIKSHEFDEYTTKGLIEIASKYPNAALISFKNNFNVMLARVRQKRSQEQGGEVYVTKKSDNKPAEFVPNDLDSAFKNFNKKPQDEIFEQQGTVQEVSLDEAPPSSGLDDWQNEERA